MGDNDSSNNQKFNPKYTVYKPNKSNQGTASQLELSKNGLFWQFSNQLPDKNENNNATFDWKNKITVSLGDNDISSILAFFTKPNEQEVKLFHETPSGGNKIITLRYNKDNGSFGVSVSFKKDDTKVQVNHFLTFGESLIVRQLLLNAVSKLYW